MILLFLYIILSFGVWYSNCVKHTYKVNNISTIRISNYNKIKCFVYNSYLESSRIKNKNVLSSYYKKFDTHKSKIKPSIIFSKEHEYDIVDEKKNFYKELVDPKSSLSKSNIRFSPLVSVVSLAAYLLPFIVATESFFKLLISMDLPSILEKLVKNSVVVFYSISSIPNLMDFIHFFLYSFLLKRNDLVMNRFIRFNFAQGHIIYLYNSLLSRIYSYFIQPLGDGLVATSLGYTLLFSTFVPLLYCMLCSVIGKYSQLPVISQAAYLTVSNDTLKNI